MNEIILFKLTTGEELIAKVTGRGVNTQITDAVTLVYHQVSEGRMSVGFAPFMPYAADTKDISLNNSTIAAEATPTDQILSEYNRVFSNIVIAPANAI